MPARDMAETLNKTTASGLDGPIDQFVLESAPAADRLPPMLFLAALIHGILIIGVTFNAVFGDQFAEAISLEVTIVADPDPNVLNPDDAEYLAQASQDGAGNTQEQTRPTARAESPVPVDNMGYPDGDARHEASAKSAVADQVLTTRSEQEQRIRDERREDPSLEMTRAALLEAGVDLTLPLPQDDRTQVLIRDADPRELVTSVDTRESRIAGYLSNWKNKIETVGIKYFPEQALMSGITGSPTLEVTVAASGRLEQVVIRRSSGSKLLDQVCLGILRRAAPYDPFPEAIRVDYDRLTFAYKWQFGHQPVSTTASAN